MDLCILGLVDFIDRTKRSISMIISISILSSDWGICGVGLLDSDYDRRMRDALQSQDCLYTLVEQSQEGDRARIIGSIG
ncbi:hypothetical protein [Coleofasciculus sp. FACHB-1120]|uniref:hypothetical protein n=1 Tax=Coleofasciculus sp. FACHB-1120 TaxID=2692783 RepID=UPI001A7E8B25|nr:hypothetical protein [Coleofasciculus sp. FACHB-1120]